MEQLSNLIFAFVLHPKRALVVVHISLKGAVASQALGPLFLRTADDGVAAQTVLGAGRQQALGRVVGHACRNASKPQSRCPDMHASTAC